MTKIYYMELPDGVIRRLDVLENDDVNVYINTREKDEGKEASFRKLEG